jgi:hypothetical protein
MMKRSERLHELMRSFDSETLARLDAELEAKLNDRAGAARKVEWRDDPDPSGMNWEWAEPPA